MRQQGVLAKTCEVLLGTLQQAVHHIQTGYGISKSMYQSALGDAPLQGAGQGNGAGPSLWALISSTVIISAMKPAGHGVQLLSPISNLALWIVCFAFVDDADTVQTAQTVEQTGEDVIQQVQPAVDVWEGLLRASELVVVQLNLVHRGGSWSILSGTIIWIISDTDQLMRCQVNLLYKIIQA
jgi:hypothetical protein